jgi:hypothetical protein
MSSRQLNSAAIISFLLLQIMITTSFAQNEAPISVVDVTWGIPPNRLSAGPGDRAVPLTITVQNLGSDVISGISMTLKLSPPFSNLTGGILASSYISMAMQPGQSASTQFMLNVADDALIGEYGLPLSINYVTVKQIAATGSYSSSYSSTNGYTSTSTSSKVGSSSSTQDQVSSTSSSQISNSSSTTNYIVQRSTAEEEVAIWLPGKTTFEVVSPVSVLTAGQVNPMPIIIKNTGTGSANSLTISISLGSSALSSTTAPLVIEGSDTIWHAQNLQANSSITLNPQIFASTNAMGNAYQLQVSLNYRDAVGTAQSEVHTLGFSVQGSITIVVQSVFISPAPVGAGGNITISGNLLNEGNVAAMYMNATAIIKPPFEALDGSSIYLGELDPNTPLPFSISMRVLGDTENGTYPLNVLFYYKDSMGNTQSLERAFDVTVSGVYQPPKPQVRTEFFLFTRLGLITLIIIIVAIIAIAYVLMSRRARGKQKG